MNSASGVARVALIFIAAVGIGYIGSRIVSDAKLPDEISTTQFPLDSLKVIRPGTDSTSPIARSSKPALIMVFDVNCQHCTAQIPGWKRVAEASAGDLEVIAVSLGTVPDLSTYPLFEGGAVTYAGVAPVRRLRETLGLSAVPFTALIDERNKVVATRQGVVSDLGLRTLVDRYARPDEESAQHSER